LVEAGIPLSEALMPAASASGSPSLKQTTSQLIIDIQEGRSLSSAMSKSSLFTPLMQQMCAIGEETGSLASLLQKTAQLMASDMNQRIGNLSTLLEPAIMVFLGAGIGGILVALYLPIFNLGQVF
jgi:type IV pilus assembly protein PilC